MFKKGDTAYFVFKGNFVTGRYKNFYSLPINCGFDYFPFYPVTICGSLKTVLGCLDFYPVIIDTVGSWNMPAELLEKEFAFDKFIFGQLTNGNKMSLAAFKKIAATL